MKQSCLTELDSKENLIENISSTMNPQLSETHELPINIIHIDLNDMDNDSSQLGTSANLAQDGGYSVVSKEEDAHRVEVMEQEDLYLPLDLSEGGEEAEIEMLRPFLDTLQSLLDMTEPLKPTTSVQSASEKVPAIKAKPSPIKKRCISASKDLRMPFAFRCHRKK